MRRLKYYFYFFILITNFFISTSSIAGTILISNVLSNSVTFVDEASLQIIKEIKVGYMPHEVKVSPNGKLALVANFGDLLKILPGETLTTIDVPSAKLLKTIQLPSKSRPHGLAFLSDTQALVTTQGIQSLLIVDVIRGVVDKKILLPGKGAHMVVTDAEKRFAYVSNVDSGSVTKIDLKYLTIVNHRKIGKEAEGITLNNNEDLLFVTDRIDNEVVVLRIKDLSIIKRIQTGHGPVRVELFDNGQSMVVTNTISGNAQAIDTNALTITRTFNTSHSHSPLPVPINIYVNQDQKTGYITNSFVNEITLVDFIAGTILKTFKTSYMPDGIAYSPIHSLPSESCPDVVFMTGPIEVNANIETLWRIAKNVEDYKRISHGAITAHVEGNIAPGKMIQLILYQNSWQGKLIPPSNETVTVVDENRKMLAWVRKLPDGGFTERYQLLEKISEHKTRSIILLRIPGVIGEITKLTLGKIITKALVDLNTGMKEEAESLKVL